MNIIVIGGGICGLGTAMLLAHDGHKVTLLERDSSDTPVSPKSAWDDWERKGVGQFWQPHNLLPGARIVLENELPLVQRGLIDAGSAHFDMLNALPPSLADTSRSDTENPFWTYTARRPVAEWVFRKEAERSKAINFRTGETVKGLRRSPSLTEIPMVDGVMLKSGEELNADLVIDASGRASKAPAWLGAIGAAAVEEETADCRFTYYTRYFRGNPPKSAVPPLVEYETISILTLPGDDDTWSVTIFTGNDDKALKGLKKTDRWSRVVEAHPIHAPFLAGQAITDIVIMSGVADRYRRFVSAGRPVATGFVAVADAWACTNPSAGRGISTGLKHALCLRDSIREADSNPDAISTIFDAMTEKTVTPWYRAQMAADDYRFARISAARNGRPTPKPQEVLAEQIYLLRMVMPNSMDLFRAGLEYFAALTPIQAVIERDYVRNAIDAARSEESIWEAAPMPSPSRQNLEKLAA